MTGAEGWSCRRRGFSRPLVLAVTVLAILTSSCVSTSTAPRGLAPENVAIDESLPGSWKSFRKSQLGPSSMTIQFRCDGTYLVRARVLLMGVREHGEYWVDDGMLFLSRGNGEITKWPYGFDGDRLALEEYEGETYLYTRKSEGACAGE